VHDVEGVLDVDPTAPERKTCQRNLGCNPLTVADAVIRESARKPEELDGQ